MENDTFRPRREPARSFYDAFQEMAKKEPRDFYHEELAMWRIARNYAQAFNKRIPTLDEIRAAASMAAGHVDFGAKWAYAVEKLVAK